MDSSMDIPGSPSGSTMLEHLSFDQTISRVFSIYRQGFKQFAGLGFGLLIVPILVTAFVVQPKLLSWYNVDEQAYETDPNYTLGHMGDMLKIGLLKSAVSIPFSWFVELASIHVVATIYMGRTPTLAQSLKAGCRVGPVFVAASFIAMIINSLGYVLLIVPGIYVAVRLFVFAPTIVIENAGVINSLKRSFYLVAGNWCYVFCIYTIVILIMFPGQMIWNVLVSRIFGNPEFTSLGCVGALLTTIILVPLVVICQTVMYFNLRVQKEGLNADVLWNEFGRGSSSGTNSPAGYANLLADEEEVVADVDPAETA